MIRLPVLAAFAGALATISCSDPAAPAENLAGTVAWANVGKACTSASPAFSLPQARADSLPPAIGNRFPDDSWAAAARVVPGGFGGVIIRDGSFTFFLVDTTQHQAAASALDARGVSPGVNWATAKVLPARWDFAQLYDWQRYLAGHIRTVRIITSDIDEAENRLYYGVTTGIARQELESALATLDVPCNLVAIETGVSPVSLAGASPEK
jgi:hypothetical protein